MSNTVFLFPAVLCVWEFCKFFNTLKYTYLVWRVVKCSVTVTQIQAVSYRSDKTRHQTTRFICILNCRKKEVKVAVVVQITDCISHRFLWSNKQNTSKQKNLSYLVQTFCTRSTAATVVCSSVYLCSHYYTNRLGHLPNQLSHRHKKDQ